MEIAFDEFRDGFLWFFGSLRSSFSDFLSLENKLFLVINRILVIGLVTQIVAYFEPSKDMKA